jgi:hypothetical protein
MQGLRSRLSFRLVILCTLASFCGGARLSAETQAEGRSNSLPPPNVFVRDVLNHEAEAQLQDHSLWCFDETKDDDGKQKLLHVCQTGDGEIERLIAVDGQPLTPQQARDEDRRIHHLLNDAGELKARRKKDREDGEQARKLLKLFPVAFRFQYAGKEGTLVRVSFTPNPQFRPAGHSEQVFHHMEGTLLLDPVNQRLAAMDGRLTSEVKFAGGLLGHLEKGGTFQVQQRDVGSNCWEVTLMKIQMNGKALFFKTISVHTDEKYSGFQPAPEGINLFQAAELVKRKSASAGS